MVNPRISKSCGLSGIDRNEIVHELEQLTFVPSEANTYSSYLHELKTQDKIQFQELFDKFLRASYINLTLICLHKTLKRFFKICN